jgi:hypothetical protein
LVIFADKELALSDSDQLGRQWLGPSGQRRLECSFGDLFSQFRRKSGLAVLADSDSDWLFTA